jgi:hypothetical protein
MSRKLGALVGVVLVGLWGPPRSHARQPEAVSWNVVEALREGSFRPGLTPGGDVQVLIGLFPTDDQFAKSHLLVVFPGCGEDAATPNRPILNLEEVLKSPRDAARHPSEWQDPGPRWRVCPSESAFLLEGGQGLSFPVNVDFLRAVDEGLSPKLLGEVHILSEDDLQKVDREAGIGCQWSGIVGKRRPAAHLTIDLYYRLFADAGTFFYGGYHDVFGKPGPDVLESARVTDDYLPHAANLPVDLLGFRSTLPIPRQTKDDGGRLFLQTLARSRNSDLVGDPFWSKEDAAPTPRPRGGDVNEGEGRVGTPRAPRGVQPTGLIATYHLSGRFSTKWSADHSLHPGFGFRAEAWSDDFLGIWTRVASDWVQSDGTWSLTVAPTLFFQGNHLRMYYVTLTDYYDAQDIDGNRYAWRDPDYFGVPTTFSTGHRFADTDGGTYNGVGEMVDAAMYTWSRLYWNGGINPVRSSPINLIAPNTGLACGGTSPWSCANGGNIWLIAAHASQAQVVSHELGHQLNYKFWNDKRPANAGGSHSLNSCYPGREGMTLFEGFADFLAGWVGYPGRNVADGGFGSGRWALGWDLEDRTAPPSCTNGWENELWVARTFWDLNDTRSDGSDILWFNYLGAVPALYLGNGVASNGDYRDMRFYEDIYRNAASAGHQTFISDIFEQNRQ